MKDRLLSDHIVPTYKLDSLPATTADRRDSETIFATTNQIVPPQTRRNKEGRLLTERLIVAASSR